MVKSTAKEMAALREEVFERDGYRCMWPGCSASPGWNPEEGQFNKLEMAHLTHRGMGGSKERNTADNCITLCQIHHDCLDGRTGLGILRSELNSLFRALLGSSRSTPNG